MRADLVLARTAVAHAAWRGSQTVQEEDIRVAAELALPHRRRREPFDDPGLDPERLDEALSQTEETPEEPEPDPEPPGGGGSDSPVDRPAPQGDSPSNGPSGESSEAPARNGAPPTRTSAPPSADLPDQGTCGARGRRGRPGPAFAGP